MSATRGLSRALYRSTWRPFGGALSSEYPEVISVTPTLKTTGTSHSVAMPTATAANDLLLMFTAADDFGNDIPNTAAAGWTRIANFSSDAGCAIFKKKAVGDEGGTTVTVTTATDEYFVAQVYHIHNWSGDIDEVAVATAVSGASGNTAEPPNLAPGWGVVPTLWIAYSGTSSIHALTSAPADYSGLVQTGTVSTNNAQVRTVYRQLTASAENPAGFVSAGISNWAAATVAVRGTE